MKLRFRAILIVTILLLLTSSTVALALPPRPPSVGLWCLGGEEYITTLDLPSGYPFAMMFSKSSMTAAGCRGGTGWTLLGLQRDHWNEHRLWSASGQTPPILGEYGCAKGCILVGGWPPTEICGYGWDQHYDDGW